LIAFIAVLVFSFLPSTQRSASVTKSTVVREALPRGSVVETEYFTDELGWIDNRTELLNGMRSFYQKTGVQPHLYITDTIGGSHHPTTAQVEAFAKEMYDALFDDEAHLLLIFFEFEGDPYHIWYLAGRQAKTVLDVEAMDILMDYIERYYYDDKLTDAQFFGKAFDLAGKQIMTVTRSPWILVWTVAGVIALLSLALVWWTRAKEQKNLEAEQTRKILETPLEAFGTSTELEGKYKDT